MTTLASGAPATARATRTDRLADVSWRVVRDGAPHGAANMARDHALARTVRRGAGVLRLYGWTRPTVSFGRNEPAVGLYSPAAARSAGVDCVRRPTGGRAVLHSDELTYSVVVPARDVGGAREAYRRINVALAAAMRSLGAPAGTAGSGEVRAPDAGPCFRGPAPGEVVAAGRKLVGSAQAKIGAALLQHGSIILSGDQSMLDTLAGRERRSGPAASLDALIGRVEVDDVARAVVDALAAELGGTWEPGGWSQVEIAEAERLEEERYGRDSWTWRR